MGIKKTNKTRRKIRRKSRKRLKGGSMEHFQVYVFTEAPLSSEDKKKITETLQELYGNTQESIGEPLDEYLKSEITEFVHKKGKHYPSLKEVAGFRILNIPSKLKEGMMNDSKLTAEEYKIRDTLKEKGLPFALVEAPHGLWSEGIAVIGLEKE
jgi:hypothetical protein